MPFKVSLCKFPEMIAPILAYACLACCSEADRVASRRVVTGHVVELNGIVHGHGALAPYRNCGMCHGMDLFGGNSNLVPSCFSCHGQLWENGSFDQLRAPASHSDDFAGFMHNVGSRQPDQNCAGCHDVFANDPNKTGSLPNCLTCHEAVWE